MRRSTFLTLLLAAAISLLTVPIASGASPDLVVSQVYAGGGNSGATFANDFVELFNRSSSSVDLSGWSVQYAPATGTSWQVTTLTGSLAPGHHYLVALASGGANGAGFRPQTRPAPRTWPHLGASSRSSTIRRPLPAARQRAAVARSPPCGT